MLIDQGSAKILQILPLVEFFGKLNFWSVKDGGIPEYFAVALVFNTQQTNSNNKIRYGKKLYFMSFDNINNKFDVKSL